MPRAIGVSAANHAILQRPRLMLEQAFTFVALGAYLKTEAVFMQRPIHGCLYFLA